MAEFGAAAAALGLVSVACDLAENGKKLYRFCQDVKNAKEDIRDVAEELETLSNILRDVDCWLASVPNDLTSRYVASLTDAQQRCKTIAHDSSLAVTRLEDQIKAGKKRGHLKAVWEKDAIQKYLFRIQRAQSALQTSFALLTMIRSNAVHLLAVEIRQNTSSWPSLVQSPSSVTDTSAMPPVSTHLTAFQTRTSHQIRTSKISRKAQSQLIGRFKLGLPLWMSRYIWEIEIERAYLGWGWNACLRCRTVVPYSCPFFETCERLDLFGVQRLLDIGQASVHDEDPAGNCAFDVIFHETPIRDDDVVFVVKFLLARGLHPARMKTPVLRSISNLAGLATLPSQEALLLDLYQASVDAGYLDSDKGVPIDEVASVAAGCPSAVCKLIVKSMEACQPRLSLKERISRMSGCLHCYTFTTEVPTIQDWLGLETMNLVWSVTDPESHEIVSLFLLQLLARYHYECRSEGQIKDILQLLRPSGALSRPLKSRHHPERPGYSMLELFVDNYVRNMAHEEGMSTGRKEISAYVDQALQIFARDLLYLGVNLISYGKEQPHLIFDRVVTVADTYGGYEQLSFRWTVFEYGPEPKDWKAQVVELDLRTFWSYAGQFWRMLEHPARAIPGSWDFETLDDSDFDFDFD